jgi:hypothetical protein
MAWLALGMTGDFYVVCRKVTQSEPIALAISVALLTVLFGIWFGYTEWEKHANESRAMDAG